jgi:multidrug efflux pump subunit AcrA (membrane-fusion protein)
MKYLSQFKRYPYFSSFFGIVIIVALFFIFRKDQAPDIDFAKVEFGNLINEINVTGRVKASEEVDLGFERSGRVQSVNTKEGEQVYTGQVLVRLENGSIMADLDKAKANLKSAEAVLSELRRGSRPEEITIQKTKIINAENTVLEAKETLLDEIKNTYTVSDNAIGNKVDLLFLNPKSSNPDLKVSSNDPQLEINVQFERTQIGGILNNWKSETLTLNTDDNLTNAGSKTKGYLETISAFLNKMAIIVNGLEVNTGLSQATIDTYQTNISTARTSIDGAKSSLTTDNEALVNANSTLNLEKRNLELIIAGTDPQKILAQEATVEGAKADINKIQAELLKTLIISPINGVVTNQEAKVGEIISLNSSVVFVISDKSLEIEVNVPESDVVLISVGNNVRINLDAYGSDLNFFGKVVSINPGEIVLQGVPAYKTIIEFEKEDERIKPGMTADAFILGEMKENVLSIPRRAVLKKIDREYVRMLDGGKIVEIDVKTGFKSSDGRIEIVEGLKEGQEVIIFLEEK